MVFWKKTLNICVRTILDFFGPSFLRHKKTRKKKEKERERERERERKKKAVLLCARVGYIP